MPNDSNENNRTVKIGTILIAIDECRMETDGRPTLTLKKEYAVKESSAKMIAVKDDENHNHYFDRIGIHKFFIIKSDCELIVEEKPDYPNCTGCGKKFNPADTTIINDPSRTKCAYCIVDMGVKKIITPIEQGSSTSVPTDKKTTAEEFLKGKGIKNKPLDSGIGAPEAIENPRYRVSNAMEEYTTLRIAELREEAGNGLPSQKEIGEMAEAHVEKDYLTIKRQDKIVSEAEIFEAGATRMKEKATTILLAKEQQHKLEIERLTNAIRWACGEVGEFRSQRANEGKWYWRKELRERSGVVYVPPAENDNH